MLVCAIGCGYRGGERLLFVVDIVGVPVDRLRGSWLLCALSVIALLSFTL